MAERREFARLRKEMLDFFYEDRLIGRSYNQVYDYLITQGHNLDKFGSDTFRYDRIVDKFFKDLTGVSIKDNYIEIFKNPNNPDKVDYFDYTYYLDVERLLIHVPFIGTAHNSKKNFHFFSLQLFRDKMDFGGGGVSFIEYAYHIKIEKQIFIDDDTLRKTYNEITQTNHSKEDPNCFSLPTTEAMAKLVDMEQATFSRNDAKWTRILSYIAIGISLISLIVPTYYSREELLLAEKKDREDSINFQDLKGVFIDQRSYLQKQNLQYDSIINLTKQQNQLLRDTIDVRIKKKK